MLSRPIVLIVVLFLACVCTPAANALPCFPGAQGFGTDTPGGRGGRVMVVTNLNDDGPGSLREACTAPGPRIVVFAVGGNIRLKKALRITEPFITIAGQTAPGEGICLRDAAVFVETHDVVVRFIRSRVGASLNEPFNEQNAIEATGEGCYNVVIDHCSFSWAIDENIGIVSGAHDVTFSYNIVSEALRQPFTKTKIGKERSHSMAMILGNNPNYVTVHHNLLADCNSRNPRIQGGTHDFVNNVVYDWGFLTATFSRNPRVNFIGNYYKMGPASLPIKAIVSDGDIGRIYVRGNISPQRTSDDMPEWEPLTDADPAQHRAMEPFVTAPLEITGAEQAYEDVLTWAGCRLPAQDSVDVRVIRNTYLGWGEKTDRPEDVGGYADLPVAFGAPDTDADGLPDTYEVERGLDPNDPRDSARLNGSGYANLEVYLNSLVESKMNGTARVVTYPVPDATDDSPYAVAVDGKLVPIEKAGDSQGAYYARFQFTRRVRATVSIKGGGKPQFDLKPERYRDAVTLGDGDISFDVFAAGPRFITSTIDGNQQWPLIVIAEEYNPAVQSPSGSAVFSVRDHGVTGSGVETVSIQRVLDACAARKGGGVVYFGPGVYTTGTLRIGDNTTVYLAPGSLIRASTDPADFPVDEGRKEQGTHGPVCSFSRMLLFDRCSNSQLSGYGVIDGMGTVVRNKHGRHVQLVDVTGCTNVRIENVVLRDSAEWTLHILGSKNVFVNNLKILNDWDVDNTDGIDPDGSRDIYITRFTGFCGDDAVAIKTTGNSDLLAPAVNINVRDCAVMTRKTAYKIGTETYADIYDVLFQNCEAVNSSRGIGIWMEDGHTISDVTFRDVNFDLREIPGESMSGEPIRAVIERRHGAGAVRDILFDRVVSHSPYKCLFQGLPESKLTNFSFWGCRWFVKPRQIKMGKQPVLDIENAKDFTFKFAYLTWLGVDPANWDGFVGAKNSENVFVREVEEKRE